MIPRCSLSTLTSRQTSNRRSCWPYALSNAHRNKSKARLRHPPRSSKTPGAKSSACSLLGVTTRSPDPLKACFVDYPVPVWTLPAVDFNDDDAISKADEAFATNVDAAELTAVLESPFDAPTTPYAFQYGLLGKAKADKKTIVLPEGNEDRIIKAADYLLERRHRRSDHRRRRKRHSRPWSGIGIEIAWQGEIPSQG